MDLDEASELAGSDLVLPSEHEETWPVDEACGGDAEETLWSDRLVGR